MSSYTPFYQAIFSHGQARGISRHLYKLFIPVLHRTQENNYPKKRWYAHLKKFNDKILLSFYFFSECPALTAPAAAAGSLSTADHYEGITVTLTCNSGYTLVGDSSSTCNSGSWGTALGTCEQGKVDKKAMIGNRYNRIPHPVLNTKLERDTYN